ncbi:MAG TPA: SulP family inorganic anion transporter, partial [Gemmatimonadaceae bacterium]|nr:SulP family inorganic anion transporter [Gemmatimonadaceae bacterium]
WIRDIRPAAAGADLVAGITLAAYAIPVALAYASLAGLPPEIGIYGYLLGGLGYAILGTSKQLAIGPTSAISLTVGATLATLSNGDPKLALQLATLTAVTAAALCLIAWIFKLSTLSSFISETILLGFKAGAGLTIASTQLASFFGVPAGGDGFFSRVVWVAQHLGDVHVATLVVGVIALTLLFLGKFYLPGRPIALVVVVLAIILVNRTSLHEAGLVLVGAVPPGLPRIGWPALRLRDVDGIIPLAFACVLLAYIEGLSAARTFAAKHGYPLDARQELLALGGANLLVGLGGGYPVAGGLSQSAVNDTAGAKTPLSLVISSATLALCLMFLTGLVASLPKAVLAAIVLVAVYDLIKLREIVNLRRVSRFEFNVAMVALVGVLLLGILKGVMLAAFASVVVLLARAAFPHVAVLGRIPGTRRYSDLEVSPDNERVPGVMPIRVEASLFYFNVDHVRDAVLARVAAGPDVRTVIADLSSSPAVDLAGAHMLAELHEELAAKKVAFRVVDARAAVRDMLRLSGVAHVLGTIDR